MRDDEPVGLPQLREETRAARGRTLELVISVVALSALVGLAVNLGSTLLARVLDTRGQLVLTCACLAVTLLILMLLVPRISTTVKEFHEEIELLFPLQVSAQEIEIIPIRYYNQLDVLSDALKRFPPAERQQLAATVHAAASKNPEAFRAVTQFALEAAQFLFAVELVKRSRQLLGDGAEYHKVREVARMQTAITKGEWQAIAAQAPANPFFARQTQGVPEKTLLPGGVRVHLADAARQMKDATRRTRESAAEDVTLLSVTAGRDTAIHITAVVGHSEHAMPTRGQLRRGLTTRTVLRNAENRQLCELARAEEAAAEQLDHAEQQHITPDEMVALNDTHNALYTKLYRGNEQPRLLRVFVRFDGVYRIRLLDDERRQRGLYAWGAALSRLLSRADIEVFMASLKAAGQKTPNRIF